MPWVAQISKPLFLLGALPYTIYTFIKDQHNIDSILKTVSSLPWKIVAVNGPVTVSVVADETVHAELVHDWKPWTAHAAKVRTKLQLYKINKKKIAHNIKKTILLIKLFIELFPLLLIAAIGQASQWVYILEDSLLCGYGKYEHF